MTTDKTKPFSNELEIQLVYLREFIDRCAYFNEISDAQHKDLKATLNNTISETNSILNRIE